MGKNIKKGHEIARLIDHTLLRADATAYEIQRLCEEAMKHAFYSVCVHSSFVKTAVQTLSKTGVKVSAAIGFPLGTSVTQVKVYEAMEAVLLGAAELDVVIHLGWAKAGEWRAVEKELSALIMATPGVTHKVIIETAYLTDDEKVRAARAVMNARGAYVKTSTGFTSSGASVKDVRLIRSATEGAVGIKASGGIRTLKDVKALVKAGATRIGTSSGVQIMAEISKHSHP